MFKSWSFLIEDLLIPGSFFGRRLVKQRNGLPGQIRKFGVTGLFLFAGSVCGWAQAEATPAAQPIDAMTTAVRELQEEVRELRDAVVELRSEAGQYRAETEQLRRELQSSRSSSVAPEASAANAASPVAVPNPTQAAPRQDRVEDRVAALEESSQLLNSKINDQYQTKIEAASKYRMRLSGIVLLNVFGNQGSVDNQDFPTWAVGPGANTSAKALGASLRQSEVGLEAFGPRLAGAKTTGWIGRALPLSRDKTMLSFLRSRRLRSPRWPCPLSAMPATFGDGFRRCEWNTASIFRRGRTSRSRGA